MAKILQDADKMSGIMTWGIVAITRYFGGKDYIDGKEIIRNWRNRKRIRELSDSVLSQIEDGKILQGVMKGLKFLLEYADNSMLHTKSAYELIKENYKYLVKCRNYLIEKFNL